MIVDKLIVRWGQCIYVGLCASIVLLGVGRIELLWGRASVGAWSVSRTTFFIWLIWKVFVAVRERRLALAAARQSIPLSLLLFFIAVTLSLLPDFHGASEYRYFFFASMHFLMLVDLCSDKGEARLLLLALGLVPVVLVVRGILYDPMLLDITQMRRFGYPLDHPNTAGYLFSMSIPLGLAIAVGEKGYLRILALVSCCAQWAALALTYSRAAWFGAGAAMVFLAVNMNRRREVAAIVILTGLTASFVTPLQTRFSTLLNPRSDFAITDRLQVINAALKLAVASPVLGVGYGRDRLRQGLRESRLEMRHIAHTHNVYVELLATTGLLGLGAFLWLICGAFYQAFSHSVNREAPNRPGQIGIAAAWIAFAVTGLGDVPFYHHETRIFFFSLIALTYLYTREASPEVSTMRRS